MMGGRPLDYRCSCSPVRQFRISLSSGSREDPQARGQFAAGSSGVLNLHSVRHHADPMSNPMSTSGTPHTYSTEDEIDRTLEETFPASDPPGWTLGTKDPPAVARKSEIGEDPVRRPITKGVCIGHVHLKVADLERAIAFYCGVLGFELTQRYGSQAAFVSAGGYHHHIGLNTWESAGGSPPPPGTTGLYHFAILYPSRTELAYALRRLLAAGIPLHGASDHGVSEALYLSDPDGNGIELYWDRPREQWPRSPEGRIAMFTKPLDLRALFHEAEASSPIPDLPTGPRDL